MAVSAFSLRFFYSRPAAAVVRPGLKQVLHVQIRGFASKSKKRQLLDAIGKGPKKDFSPSTKKAAAPAAIPKKTTNPTTAHRAPKTPPKIQQLHVTLEERLSISGKDTLLYQTNNTWSLVGCYGICFGSIGWIIYTYNTNIANQPPGLAPWVKKVNWVAIFLMSTVAVLTAGFPTRYALLLILFSRIKMGC
jgi:hypothetical protein